MLFLFFTACKKSDDNDPTTGWTQEDQTFYENILNLQDNAMNNYESWSQSMDSLETIVKLQQYFLDDPSVTSAIVNSQGIAVQYSNGMRGGVFLNPKDAPDESYLSQHLNPEIRTDLYPIKSLVNNKTAILINPHYWERISYNNAIEDNYNVWLPKAGFSLKYVLRNTAANLNCFSGLSGYGLIHIYSHGWAWPEETNIEDVYLLTGERVSNTTTVKYGEDIKSKKVIISSTRISRNQWANVYFINQDFIATHNDFAKDTVLFYGGFCYSFLGKWDQLYQKFAKGSYLGFTWSVATNKNSGWAISLVDSLCDTTARPPYNNEKWMNGPNPAKSYYSNADQLTVSIHYVGDAKLTLLKDSANILTLPATNITQTSATGGGEIKYDGGSSITARGVCWSTSPMPTITGSHTTDGSGTGVFTSNMTGLSLNTQYYVRAYATNGSGTYYGNEISFTTVGEIPPYKSVYFNLQFGVHRRIYDKNGTLSHKDDYTLDVIATQDNPCSQQGNHLSAPLVYPDQGTIDVTINADQTISLVLDYLYSFIWLDGTHITVNCSLANIPLYDPFITWDKYQCDDVYPHVVLFQGRKDYGSGGYETYEIIQNPQLDKGAMVILYK